MSRLFRAEKELFKLLRGDPRVYNFFIVEKANLHAYCVDWLYGSKNDAYRQLGVEFMGFLVRQFEEIDSSDFLD